MSEEVYTDANGRPISPEQAERHEMVEQARRVGVEQHRSRNVMAAVTDQRAYADMVPPQHRNNPDAYLRAMAGKGAGESGGEAQPSSSRENAPKHIDSAKVGELPIDRNILKSCTTAGGFECHASALRPDGLVTYLGMTMKAAQAVEMGLLEQDERGTFRVPNSEARAAEVQAEEQQAKAQHDVEMVTKRETGDEPCPRTQGAVDFVSKHVPEQARNALINDFVVQGDLSTAAVNEVGRKLGWTDDQAQGAAYVVVTGLQNQAARAAMSAGVPAGEVDALWQFLGDRYPNEQRTAALALIYASDAKPIRDLAKKYLGQKPRR